jgi:hypothetical protein
VAARQGQRAGRASSPLAASDGGAPPTHAAMRTRRGHRPQQPAPGTAARPRARGSSRRVPRGAAKTATARPTPAAAPNPAPAAPGRAAPAMRRREARHSGSGVPGWRVPPRGEHGSGTWPPNDTSSEGCEGQGNTGGALLDGTASVAGANPVAAAPLRGCTAVRSAGRVPAGGRPARKREDSVLWPESCARAPPAGEARGPPRVRPCAPVPAGGVARVGAACQRRRAARGVDWFVCNVVGA